jgi:HEAT repeat protein
MLLDDRWYMVRNACFVLSALQDPALCELLEPALKHADARVQRVALSAIVTAHAPELATTLGKVLPALPAHLQEAALDELLLLKDPATAQGIGDFVLARGETKGGLLLKGIEVLAVLPSEEAAAVLGKVLCDTKTSPAIRKAALLKLAGRPSAQAQQMLADFARLNPLDPLAVDCRRAGNIALESATLGAGHQR